VVGGQRTLPPALGKAHLVDKEAGNVPMNITRHPTDPASLPFSLSYPEYRTVAQHIRKALTHITELQLRSCTGPTGRRYT
jgi:hypothetical protein